MPHATAERSASTIPEDYVSATDSSEEADDDEEQEEAGTKERTGDEVDSPTGEEKVGPEAQENEPEQAPQLLPPMPFLPQANWWRNLR